jgi:hypothetical protein
MGIDFDFEDKQDAAYQKLCTAQTKYFLEHGGDNCPYCGIYGSGFYQEWLDVQGLDVSIHYSCNSCGHSFTKAWDQDGFDLILHDGLFEPSEWKYVQRQHALKFITQEELDLLLTESEN